ncbi:MAG TPA: SRPBCC family protein [Gemmatimonadales bacterium]|nr:SRPBCC family protein [Gemmatimonadales bacterium]
MQITKTFTVRAARDPVWAFLTDPPRVASCLPGAAITGQTGEGAYTGTITVKVGPISTSYKGTVTFERLDRHAWTAEIVASGQDVRGKGGAELRMTSRLVAQGPSETEVTVVSDVNVTGILAQMGRGMIQDVSDQLFQEFTTCTAAALESTGATPGGGPARRDAAPTAQPIQVVSFGAGIVGRAAGRAARHPATWAAIVAAALLLWLLWLR